jgi:hypothetical protein
MESALSRMGLAGGEGKDEDAKEEKERRRGGAGARLHFDSSSWSFFSSSGSSPDLTASE